MAVKNFDIIIQCTYKIPEPLRYCLLIDKLENQQCLQDLTAVVEK
jgi:hypothetical protein